MNYTPTRNEKKIERNVDQVIRKDLEFEACKKKCNKHCQINFLFLALCTATQLARNLNTNLLVNNKMAWEILINKKYLVVKCLTTGPTISQLRSLNVS
jgi:hypothetical protein